MSEAVIWFLKLMLSRHGIPQLFRSGNDPLFHSKMFEDFLKNCKIKHVTSSTYYPQSNGEAESMVKVAKGILSHILWLEFGTATVRMAVANQITCPAAYIVTEVAQP